MKKTQKSTHIHTRIVFAGLFLFVFNFYAHAQDLSSEIQYKEQIVQELKSEIAQIDSEMVRCERVKKNWQTATIIGGVGVAATGAAAIIQVVNANKSKESEKQTDTKQ